MEKKTIKEEDISVENINEYLNEIYSEICDLWRSGLVNDEGSNLLADCLDGAPDGVVGVQILIGRLYGDTYSIVTDPETGERKHKKDEPVDPKIIYEQANQLVDYVNSVLENYKRKMSL